LLLLLPWSLQWLMRPKTLLLVPLPVLHLPPRALLPLPWTLPRMLLQLQCPQLPVPLLLLLTLPKARQPLLWMLPKVLLTMLPRKPLKLPLPLSRSLNLHVKLGRPCKRGFAAISRQRKKATFGWLFSLAESGS
jgi:hypothetical protein